MTDVASLISGQNASLATAQAQMASDFSAINDSSNALVKATQAEGTDNATIATQQAVGLLQAQQAAQSVATSYGGNPASDTFVMNKLGQQWMETEDQRIQAAKIVQQKQSVSFLDDPLTWLTNKLTVNTDINNYNNLEEQSNDEYQHLERINALNTQTAESMKAIATTQTAATVAATSDEALQKTTIAVANAKIQGLLYNAKGVQDVTQMGQEQVNNAVSGANVAIAQGHLAVAQAQLGVMQKELTMKADLYQEEIKQKVAADASDMAIAGYVNKGRAAMGLQPIPQAKIFTLMKIGGEAGEALKQQMTAGSMTDAINKPIIAATPGTAARYLATSASPLSQQNKAVAPVTNLLADSYNTARNPQNAQMMGVNPRDPNSLDGAVTNLVADRVKQMAANIKPNDHSNIYQAPPLTALATTASFKANPLYTAVLEPLVKSGMAETDPNKIMAATTAAIQAGQIKLGDAAIGLANLFSTAAALNTETKDFTRFGIAPQANYVTMLSGTGSFGTETKVDMTNKAQVTTAIMKQIAVMRQLDVFAQGGQ